MGAGGTGKEILERVNDKNATRRPRDGDTSGKLCGQYGSALTRCCLLTPDAQSCPYVALPIVQGWPLVDVDDGLLMPRILPGMPPIADCFKLAQ